ncbi:reversion-inducing cysteine-rich protein with Kazal motifs-like [Penaeus indicus]|uniref:reversion-inducing cysteine-rich protein with Kazal motifs-like n=1 Tax=Penaeus indicus TaxID=29960 RepID=UPI00300D31FD
MKDGRHPRRGSRPWSRSLAILLLLCVAAAARASDTPAPEDEGDCCSVAPSGCRAACHKVPLWKLGGEEREEQIAFLRAACPAHLRVDSPVLFSWSPCLVFFLVFFVLSIGPGLVSRSLQVDKTVAMREHVTDLPCGCSDHWVPVCAANGRTFPSECLARCAGVEAGQWAEGECGDQDVCGRAKCRRGELCVPAPATCLTPPTTLCPQHICVPLEAECPPDALVPACDARGTQHPSLCHLVRSGAQPAHLGNCSSRCSMQGEVCGRDGRTWASECQAAAHLVPVDYPGRCRGVRAGGGLGCPSVACPSQPREGCVGVTSSGWCCGRVCGGGVALTWATRAVEVAAVALPSRRPLTASALVAALAAHVSVSECEVRGHITLEGHLLLLVTPSAARGAFAAHADSSSSSAPPPPPLVARACEVEAERIAGAVMMRSPRLLSALPAAALTLAAPAHTSAAPLAPRPPCPLALALAVAGAWAAARLAVRVS